MRQWVPALSLFLCLTSPLLAESTIEELKVALLARTDELLQKVESVVLYDLTKEELEIEMEASSLVQSATGDAEREAQLKAEEVAMRQKVVNLSRKIDDWATSGKEILKTVSAEELNEAMAEARAIARHYGLDVEKLGKLYELGKKTIKNADFVVPDKLPPDEDESMRTYFESFFIFAEEREKELSEYREKQQEYRLSLFKRVTLAYIRALLASSQAVPDCSQTQATVALKIGDSSLQTFGCKDPVVEQLRSYVQAVQKIAEADSGAYATQAELVIAEQILAADMAAAIPLVGDAIDFYQLYSGENLAGECLSRVEYGLTAVFTAIPFLPANWATQVVKRMGLEDKLASFLIVMAQAGEWTDEMAAGMAARFGVTPEMFIKAKEGMDALSTLLTTEIVEVGGVPQGGEWVSGMARKFGVSEERITQVSKRLSQDITLGGGGEVIVESGKITRSAARELNKPLEEQAIQQAKYQAKDLGEKAAKKAAEKRFMEIAFQNNLRASLDAQQYLRQLPAEVRERMLKRSRELMAENLDDIPANVKALAGDFSEVKELSNMVPEHLEAILRECQDPKMDSIVIFRSVNSKSTEKLAQHFGTKNMQVKGKSADWGPQAAFIPVDQKFSKMGNPDLDSIDHDEIKKFYDKVQECLAEEICQETNLVLASGDEVFTWKVPGGDERPVVKRKSDGRFIDDETGEVLDPDMADVKPMSVLAAPNVKGELVPLTADYDLLAVGSKNPVNVPGKWDPEKGAHVMDPTTGYIDDTEREMVDRINKAGREAGYEGGDLSHHGPEVQFVASPGALAQDPYVTVVDPELGMRIIPRCEYECMEKWCRTSGMCGGMSVCRPNSPTPPCMMIDPDRLLKDYMSDARLRGYPTMRPNASWDWGAYNGLAGWSPKVVLDVPANSLEEPGKWAYGQYKMTQGVKPPPNSLVSEKMGRTTYEGLTYMGMQATQYLFTCPGTEPPATKGGA